MAENLIPVFDVPEIKMKEDGYDRSYHKSAAWDYEKGDFVTDSAGHVMESTGKEAFMSWCFKAAQTERYSCLAYDSDIGAELERAMAEDDEKLAESMMRRTITEALKANPRTEAVENFEFFHNGDELHCSFDVKGVQLDKSFRVSI